MYDVQALLAKALPSALPSALPHILVSSGGQLLVATSGGAGGALAGSALAPKPAAMPPLSVSPLVTSVTATMSQVLCAWHPTTPSRLGYPVPGYSVTGTP